MERTLIQRRDLGSSWSISFGCGSWTTVSKLLSIHPTGGFLTSVLDTVISSFPRRWGRNKPDPSAVHRGIRDRLGDLDADEIQSVYDLALIVIDECSKVFFDQTKALDQRPEVIDLFSSAISKIVSTFRPCALRYASGPILTYAGREQDDCV